MYKGFVLFLLSLALIGGILYYVGFNETVGAMLSIRLEYFFLLILLQLFTMFLSAVKWRLILRHVKVSFTNLLAATFVGYFINNITPIGMAGGEPVKAYLLSKKEGIAPEKAFSSVVVDLFLEIIPIFLLSSVAIFLILTNGISPEIALVIIAASFVLLLFFVLALTLAINKEYSMKIINVLICSFSRIPYMKGRAEKIHSEIEVIYGKFNKAMKEQMLDNYILLFGTCISIIVWSLRLLRVYVIFLAIGINIPLATLVIVQAFAIVVTFIPVSPGALGIWEGTNIALFSLLGASAGVTAIKAATVTMIDRLIFYVFPTVLGVVSAMLLGVDVLGLVKKEATGKVDMENVAKVIESET
ncbi:MAG: flippase-like domain-containing protein [Candidatus Altiarchaeia archaeon]